MTGLECGGFDDSPLKPSRLHGQMIGRALRVSQSAPQTEFVDLVVDASEPQTGFTFLGAIGASTEESMITGSAPQSLIEEMPQPPQEGGIN